MCSDEKVSSFRFFSRFSWFRKSSVAATDSRAEASNVTLRNEDSQRWEFIWALMSAPAARKRSPCGKTAEFVSSATVEYPLDSPKPGWSEQNPADWWQASIDSIKQVLKTGKIKPADVAGIGLSGQMHGSVFLDRDHDVIRPAILWNDQRTAAQCADIEAKAGGRKKLINMVANPALTGFTAPKILWLRDHEIRNYARTAQVLLPKDYIRFRLTGEFATEVSDASGTLLLDVKHRRWCKPLLDKLEHCPRPVAAGL